jgi:hypothetical protein
MTLKDSKFKRKDIVSLADTYGKAAGRLSIKEYAEYSTIYSLTFFKFC